MPEYIRALVCILAMTALVFWFGKAPATALAMSKADFVLRRNTWIYITLAGFLSQSIWIFYLLLGYLVYKAAKKDTNRLALFFFLILAMPELSAPVPGFAGINYIVIVNYQRVLVWVLLLPIFWKMFFDSQTEKITWNFADIALVIYFVLNAALQFQYQVFTEWVRYLFGWLSDVLVPYFVISRCIKSTKEFKEIFMSFIIGAMVISLIGVFEFSKKWLIYQPLGDAVGVDGGMGYIIRGDNIRAIATTGQAIILGFVIAVAISYYSFLNNMILNKKIYLMGVVLLIAGIISPLSKGPWLGAAVAILLSTSLGPNMVSRLAKITMPLMLIFVVLLFTDYGDTIISYLPFVGDLDEGSMSYRQLIMDRSKDVIMMNPYFGSYDYMLYLEDLRQGQGIIDIVNNYIGVALNCGLVGLSIYLLFFVGVFGRIVKRMRHTPFQSEEHRLGQILIGTMTGILLMISAVSDILNVPLLTWGTAAMGIAYSRMILPGDKKTT